MEPRAPIAAPGSSPTPSRDGVSSHGLNRFPRFMRMIRSGVVDCPRPAVRVGGTRRSRAVGRPARPRQPERARRAWTRDRAGARARHRLRGAREHQPLDARRQLRLAGRRRRRDRHLLDEHAAEPAAVGRRREPRIGNNPLIIAVPRAAGHVVLDMAMSQFSVGALGVVPHARRARCRSPAATTPTGELTRDPAAIEASRRLLPIGFWKGSGLALVLDLVAARCSPAAAPRTRSRPSPSGKPACRRSSSRCCHDPAPARTDRRSSLTLSVRSPTDDGPIPRRADAGDPEPEPREGVPVEPAIWDEVRAF